MEISFTQIYHYLLSLIILGTALDIFETLYGLSHGLFEQNFVALFFISLFSNNAAGILTMGLMKILLLISFYTLLSYLASIISHTGIFLVKIIRLGWNYSILLLLGTIVYTTYYAVMHNLYLILTL